MKEGFHLVSPRVAEFRILPTRCQLAKVIANWKRPRIARYAIARNAMAC